MCTKTYVTEPAISTIGLSISSQRHAQMNYPPKTASSPPNKGVIVHWRCIAEYARIVVTCMVQYGMTSAPSASTSHAPSTTSPYTASTMTQTPYSDDIKP